MLRLVLLLVLVPQDAPSPARREIDRRADEAVDRGARALKALQLADGRYVSEVPVGYYDVAPTAFVAYTLLHAGTPVGDPSVRKAIDWLVARWKRQVEEGTYARGLMCLALSEAILRLEGDPPEAWPATLQEIADRLVDAQKAEGGWSYSKAQEGHDHSNTQFAIGGLRAAANAGAKVPAKVWDREVAHFKSAQYSNGGWDYACSAKSRNGPARATARMTAAGIMCAAIAHGSAREKRDPADIALDGVVARGLEALAAHAAVQSRQRSVDYYWLYSLERACLLTGKESLGKLDWYVDGAARILAAQQPDGLWKGEFGIADSCFALLFLRRAYVPLADPSLARNPPKRSPEPAPTPTAAPKPDPPAPSDRPREAE